MEIVSRYQEYEPDLLFCLIRYFLFRFVISEFFNSVLNVDLIIFFQCQCRSSIKHEGLNEIFHYIKCLKKCKMVYIVEVIFY